MRIFAFIILTICTVSYSVEDRMEQYEAVQTAVYEIVDNPAKYTTKEQDKAIEWLEDMVDKGDPFSLLGLGDCYLHGKIVRQNTRMAIVLFEECYDSDYTFFFPSRAALKLSKIYESGIGIDVDYKKAFDWLEQCKEDHFLIDNQIGVFHENGLGMTTNLPLAKKFYQQAIDKRTPADLAENKENYYLPETNLSRVIKLINEASLKNYSFFGITVGKPLPKLFESLGHLEGYKIDTAKDSSYNDMTRLYGEATAQEKEWDPYSNKHCVPKLPLTERNDLFTQISIRTTLYNKSVLSITAHNLRTQTPNDYSNDVRSVKNKILVSSLLSQLGLPLICNIPFQNKYWYKGEYTEGIELQNRWKGLSIEQRITEYRSDSFEYPINFCWVKVDADGNEMRIHLNLGSLESPTAYFTAKIIGNQLIENDNAELLE